MPRIVSVTAPGNGSGKTSLIVAMLSSRRGVFTALKASTVYRDGSHCPRAGSGCACRRLTSEFTVINDRQILEEPRTDTGRFAEAGAARTLWCLARPGAHADMWADLTSGVLREDELILAEGGGAIEVMKPERLIMVASAACPRERWKETTWPMMSRADLVVVNSHGDADQAGSLAREISSRVSTRVVVEDVSKPLAEWRDPSLSEILAEFSRIGAV